jgi:hypothetical protein
MIAALRSVIQAVGSRHCPASRKKTKANFSCRADPEIGIWRKDALSPLSYSVATTFMIVCGGARAAPGLTAKRDKSAF